MGKQFTQNFDRYVCVGDTITLDLGHGLEARATVYHDHDAGAPDKQDDGFWPSLDPKSAGYIGPKTQSTLRRHMAKARKVLAAWQNDEWFYCGVAVTIWHDDERLTGEYDSALWGVECNYPGSDNRYLREVANELLGDALTGARRTLQAHNHLLALLPA